MHSSSNENEVILSYLCLSCRRLFIGLIGNVNVRLTILSIASRPILNKLIMSSSKSIELLLFVERISGYFALTPISWDEKHHKFIQLKGNPKKKILSWIRLPVGICIVVLHCLTFGYTWSCLKLAEHTSPKDWIPFIFASGAGFTAVSIHINYLRFGNEFPELYNSYIYMSNTARKFTY